MSEGFKCDHCKEFFSTEPELKGSAKGPNDEYSWRWTLCAKCAPYLTGQ